MKKQESIPDFMVRTIGKELEACGIHKSIADFYLLKSHMSIVFKPKTNKFLVHGLCCLFPDRSAVITNGNKIQFSLKFE